MPAQIAVTRPAETVFDYLAELHDAEWRSGVAAMRLLSADPHHIGARHQEVRRLLGRDVVSEAEAVVYDRPRRIAFRRATGPVRPQVTYSVAAAGPSACTLAATMSVPVGPPVVRQLLGALLDATLPRELRRLRAALERG